MDARQIIILILIFGFYFLTSYSKNKKKREAEAEKLRKSRKQASVTYDEDVVNALNQQGIEKKKISKPFEKKISNYSKIEDLESLETLNDDRYYNTKKDNFSQYKQSQVTDVEDDNFIDIDINEDELKKGIIYSEILKRPYN